MFATGYSTNPDSRAAGAEAAGQAKTKLGTGEPRIVLVFDRAANKGKLLEGVAEVFPASLIRGCAGYAPIVRESNTGTAAVLAIGGGVQVTLAVSEVGEGHEACGKAIGERLAAAGIPEDGGRVLLLFGACHVPADDKLTTGVKSVLGETFPIIGAAAVGDQLYEGRNVLPASNLGVLLTGDFKTAFSRKSGGGKEGLIASAGEAVKHAVEGIQGKVSLVLVFDCGGRRGALGEDIAKELAAMKASAGDDVPFFGFYGSGEIGPEDNDSPSRGVGFQIAVCAVGQ